MFENSLKNYAVNGSFTFKTGDALSKQSKAVPNLPGIYIIYTITSNTKELVYIGKSGTMINDGSFKTQLLRKRLNNRHAGVSRQVYFENKLKDEDIETLEFNWYVTFEGSNIDVPGFVEGNLLQNYFVQNKKLPPWNKDF